MKVKDVPIGSIFTIEETPSYPKLKLKISYIDMRDRIFGNVLTTDEREARIMEDKELIESFGITPDFLEKWKADCVSDATNAGK